MKKISLFIILIFSVFFSYKIAFASVPEFNFDYFTSGEQHFILPDNTAYRASNCMWFMFRGDLRPVETPFNTPTHGGAIYNSGISCSGFTSSYNIVALMGGLASDYYTVLWGSSSGNYPDIPTDQAGVFYWDNSLSEAQPLTPPTPPTCFDGIQNQDETGIDTGGICNTTTRITNINPANGATTATTDVTISADYYLNSTTAFGDETGIVVYLNRVDTGNNGEINSFWWDTPITYDSLTSVSHTFSFNSGEIWEMDFLFTRLAPNNPYKPPNLSRFAVVNDPNVGATGYTTCSITDISGCMQNALVYLFYPSSASLRNFDTLYNDYINKPPIGYIVAIQNEMKNINLSGSAVFTLQSMPVLNTYIFNVLRTGLSWIFWVAFAYVLFHRVKYIEL